MLAVGLLSGGLDSSLAVKLVMDQGIEVIAIKFTSPFCNCDSGGCNHAAELARKLGIRLINIPKGQEYLDIVRDPKFGRGSGMNPCIDCRIFMFKKAREIAEDLEAEFIFTGEVIGQRPMSQHRATMALIDREAGLEGKVVRPLSGKLLPGTEAERNGWIDREALLDISGRGRKTQIALATEGGIDFPCPSGGCLLTSKEFASKLRDLFAHSPGRLTPEDVALLKLGRHLRVNGAKVIIGRNENENVRLRTLAGGRHTILEPVSAPGPTCLCESDDPEHLRLVSMIVARYSDHNEQEVTLKVSSAGKERMVVALPVEPLKIDAYRIENERPISIR